jgi:hypothetical protein
VDRNIKVKFPPKSFPGKTTVAAKVRWWSSWYLFCTGRTPLIGFLQC